MKRLGLLVVLVLVQLWVPIGFGQAPYAEAPHLDSEAVVEGGITGERAVVYGQVSSTDPLLITVDIDDRAYDIRLTGVDRPVRDGQYLDVAGVVTADRTVAADGIVVREQTEHHYTYGVSALAGLIVIALIVRDWRVDRDAYALVPREAD
ncbi:hypothetical protein [Halococcoides cellulosivorans]|uniref:Uncharacterized protein n=1 Tax=Halococcoides cellulosivorans TaxID=1679096 RepID=A0A2R4WXZ5_9EURY|nr:hypothetical protein [Halococcoides cellulosivorans]AWB26413.1 hypothetical protein HARCEL1_01085 [Halococcoides cellulosivorans]